MLNSISRLGETRTEQEWSNGTEFSGYSDFPEFQANLARYTQNFGMKFRKMTVPFAPQPGISRIFCRMETNFKPKLFADNVECNGKVLQEPKTEKAILFLHLNSRSMVATSCFGSLSTLVYSSDLKWH